MKRNWMIFLVALVAVMISAPVLAQITATAHDMTSGVQSLSYDNAGNTNNNICVYCHTPHNASASAISGPLWNRTESSATYIPYGTTIAGTNANTLGTETTACLGCHDGTIAIDSILNAPGSGTWTSNTLTINGYALVDDDLTDDHPVGFSYADSETALGTGLVVQATVETAGMEFFGAGSQMECATCHEVHGSGNESFLRVSNASSDLCLTCHVK